MGAHVQKRQAEELAVRSAQDFEDFYRVRRETALVKDPAGKILALSFDGKGVVMRKEDLREATRKAAEENNHKLQTRLCCGEKRNAKRMATMGAIYTVAPFPRVPEDVIRALAGKDPPGPEPMKPDRPRPEDKRVMASLERTPEEVIAELFADARHRDPKHSKTWVALVDGVVHHACFTYASGLDGLCGLCLRLVRAPKGFVLAAIDSSAASSAQLEICRNAAGVQPKTPFSAPSR